MDNDNHNLENQPDATQDGTSTNILNEPETATEPSAAAPTEAPTSAPENTTTSKTSTRKHFTLAIVSVIVLLVLGFLGGISVLLLRGNNGDTADEVSEETKEPFILKDISTYYLSTNALADFDLAFLQLENKSANQLYSPLSIKTALGMLEAGAEGQTKEQISNIIGSYVPRKYPNNEHMSFANAIFINTPFSNAVKDSYIANLRNSFNAEVIFDPFESPNAINTWVSNKTFDLVKKLFDDDDNISDLNFVLINALAIDMDWKNRIQPALVNGEFMDDYYIRFPHIDYVKSVLAIMGDNYHNLEFNDGASEVESVEIAAVANRYNIFEDLGSAKIEQTIRDEYAKWLDEGNTCDPDEEPEDIETYLPKYLAELGDGGYNSISSSTDFYFYTDDSVRMFAKDLKEYSGMTLQYVGIMPTSESLGKFVNDMDAARLSNLIAGLKPIALTSFKDGVISEIYGYIPLFHFDYELDLTNDLKKLGIVDAFDPSRADLSGLTYESLTYIDKVSHKTDIEFSNDGIKAAAVTAEGGKGAGSCGFRYDFEVPVEKINLTFDKPYLFLIRDKDTGEVWFIGTVYQPTESN